MVAIVDSGGANLYSIFMALKRIGVEYSLVRDAEEMERADRILLPGVGSAEKCRHRLLELNMIEALLATKKPVLGICIGLQLQFGHLEEGSCSGLGIHQGTVVHLPESELFPVPHMGWNQVRTLRSDPLLDGLDNEYFFFTHSYAAPLGDGTVGVTDYGTEFASVVRRENWWGVQFHPEKSAAAGRQLLKNFMEV